MLETQRALSIINACWQIPDKSQELMDREVPDYKAMGNFPDPEFRKENRSCNLRDKRRTNPPANS